jgi:hypothetical protein
MSRETIAMFSSLVSLLLGSVSMDRIGEGHEFSEGLGRCAILGVLLWDCGVNGHFLDEFGA